MSANSPIVYLVDDDLSILKALARLLGAEGFETRTYSSPRNFLAGHDDSVPGCIVMDLAMPEMSGLALQDQLISLGHTRPIVFITGQGDIPSSVTAMRAGAINFLTKPFNDEDLLAAVREAIGIDSALRQTLGERVGLERLVVSLTAREREVFERVVRGKLNKQIAGDLGIVEKTVKVHRARVMKKMGVRSLAELVRLAERSGVGTQSA